MSDELTIAEVLEYFRTHGYAPKMKLVVDLERSGDPSPNPDPDPDPDPDPSGAKWTFTVTDPKQTLLRRISGWNKVPPERGGPKPIAGFFPSNSQDDTGKRVHLYTGEEIPIKEQSNYSPVVDFDGVTNYAEVDIQYLTGELRTRFALVFADPEPVFVRLTDGNLSKNY